QCGDDDLLRISHAQLMDYAREPLDHLIATFLDFVWFSHFTSPLLHRLPSFDQAASRILDQLEYCAVLLTTLAIHAAFFHQVGCDKQQVAGDLKVVDTVDCLLNQLIQFRFEYRAVSCVAHFHFSSMHRTPAICRRSIPDTQAASTSVCRAIAPSFLRSRAP